MLCWNGNGNHGKYGEFVYAHNVKLNAQSSKLQAKDSLFVNLFLPTTLNWKAKKVQLTQSTNFPYEPKSKITIDKGGKFTLLLRHPSWADGYSVTVNGKQVTTVEKEGYLPISRKWKKGDVVEINLPMMLQFKINGFYNNKKWNNLVLEPFANIHESRYMLYWLNVDENEWNAMKAEKEAQEAAEQNLEARTIDYVNTGTKQSESDHFMQQSHCRWHCYSYSKAFWWSCRIHQQGIRHS